MKYTVYGLSDPRDEAIFYVGITTNLRDRVSSHSNDRASAAFPRCRDIIESGNAVCWKILGQSDDKIEAKRVERDAILNLPGLANSKNPKGMLSLLLYPV